jgi:hypothetical protein
MGAVSMANAGENTSSLPPPRKRCLHALRILHVPEFALQELLPIFYHSQRRPRVPRRQAHRVWPGTATSRPCNRTACIGAGYQAHSAASLPAFRFQMRTQVAEGLDVVSEINLAYTDDDKRPERSPTPAHLGLWIGPTPRPCWSAHAIRPARIGATSSAAGGPWS